MASLCPRCKQVPPGPTHPTYCRACWNTQQLESIRGLRRPTEHVCGHCGKTYTPKQFITDSMYCSRQCKENHRRAYEQDARFNARPERQCVYCKGRVSKAKRLDAKFCSALCEARSRGALRTGRTRRNSIVAQLIKRDGASCAICSTAIDVDGIWPDPLSPSIDHILPVSLGGTDDPDNLRLTHLGCNCSRGNRAA